MIRMEMNGGIAGNPNEELSQGALTMGVHNVKTASPEFPEDRQSLGDIESTPHPQQGDGNPHLLELPCGPPTLEKKENMGLEPLAVQVSAERKHAVLRSSGPSIGKGVENPDPLLQSFHRNTGFPMR